MKKRLLSLLLVLVMLLGMLPTTVFAAQEADQVRVIVANDTFPKSSGAVWDGTLVDTWVDISETSTMMSCVDTALKSINAAVDGVETNYISSINGLDQFAGGAMSGWMGTLNDWFVDTGFGDVTVSGGKLAAGDVIRIMYSRDGGVDLGGNWATKEGWLSALSASAGELSPAFARETMTYTLTVEAGTETIDISAVAENKQDKVIVTVDGAEYRRGENVPVADGKLISVACGEKTYTVLMAVEEQAKEPTPFSQKVTVPSNGDSSWGHVSGLTLSGDDGAIYETYWASESEPYVLDVILAQGTPLDATITAAFTVGGMRAPSISGDTTVTLENGKGTISVTAVKGISFYGDTHWTINLTVDDGSAANRSTYEVELPTDTVGYTVAASGSSASPVIEGRKFNFTVTISGDYKTGEDFAVKANGETLTASNGIYTIENITEKQVVTVEGVVEKTLADKSVTIIAPVGSTVSSGRFYSYFKYDFNEPVETTTLEDGRISVVFPVPGSQAFYRVQHPNGVTFWDFDGLSAGSVFEVTAEDLYIGSTEFTKETVYDDFEKNIKDKADLYLTVNGQGWLDLDTGDTHSLNVFRNWIAVGNSISNNSVALPDVEYKVISPDGTASDVVTVTPDAYNSCYAEIKAEKAGTAIILVSYDAMLNNDGEGSKEFSAIWPENTGVIVVTVDAEDAAIATNMTVNEEANAGGKQVLDVEHDILFYLDESGAEYSFKPEDGCTVTVNRSTVGSTMTFGGFTSTGVATAEDGTVTVSGLTTGTHIIKVEKDGKAAYQVIRARQVSYELLDSEGNPLAEGAVVKHGESVTVQFHELISPLEKLSGVYNANFGFYYKGEDGAQIRTSGGTFGVYSFSGNENLQRFSVTIPDWWNEETYTISNGAIKIGGFGGSAGVHRSTTYLEGKEVNTNASGVAGVLSVLPDIVIPTEPTGINVYDVTLPVGEGYIVTGGETPVTEGESYTFTVKIKGGYDGSALVVKVNGETVTGTDGSYTVENVTEDLTITVEGVTKLEVVAPAETTTVYTNGTDGSNWPHSFGWVETVGIGGVEVESYVWDGDTCTVTLAENTPMNAVVTFVLTVNARSENWKSGVTATLNDGELSPSMPNAVVLQDGKAAAALYAQFNEARNSGTKTFVITGAAGEAVMPSYNVTLPESETYTVTSDSVTPVEAGGSYSFTVEIADGYEKSADFAVKANDVVLTETDGVYTITNINADQTITVEGVVEKIEDVTIIAPAGSTVSAGKFHTYYVYDFMEVLEEKTLEDGRVSVTFDITTGGTRGNGFYRVQNPNGVTYWNYATLADGAVFEVTAEDLYLNSTEFTSETVYRFDKNTYDLADLYVNADARGMVELEVGGTKELNVFRNWMAIESFTNAKVALPDMEYTVIDMNGNASDVVTVVPNAENSSVATVTANKAGTAVILVTYDAMTHIPGQGGRQFSAIWPENTGVIVVTVGETGTVETNMTINVGENAATKKLSGDVLDAEHDVLFYVGNEGASYTFTPEAGCTVSVNRAVVDDALTFDGFETVTANEDGSYTVSGLTSGRHIIKVEKDGKAAYQVIRARQVSYDLLDAEGNALSADYEVKAGDTIKIQFHDLINPVEKQSGVYNFNAKVSYYGEDGTRFPATKGGGFGSYDFSGNEARQTITITIPADWTGTTYTLNKGAIQIGGFGSPAGAHRDTTYATGKAPNFTAVSLDIVLGQLPEITIGKETEPVVKADWDTVYANVMDTLETQANETAPVVASQKGEWMVIGLARSEKADTAWSEGYLNNVKTYVNNRINANEQLNAYVSTDNARVILALTALGEDPTNVNGHDLTKGFTTMDYVEYQGVNGLFWALLALDSADYDDPNAAVTRDALMEAILDAQIDNKGWSREEESDVDITSMALTALAPYYSRPAVKTAVDNALTWLSSVQADDGSFGTYGTYNAESCAQVIVALTALGIDPAEDSRFVKDASVLDALLGFYVEEQKGFAHVQGEGLNQMATEQGFYAMVAYERFLAGKTSLFNMTDVVPNVQKYDVTVAAVVNGTVTVNPEQAAEGETVTVTVAPAIGYELETLTWNGNALTVNASGEAAFTMPAANVTITASFAETENPAEEVEEAIADMTVTKADAATEAKLNSLVNAYDDLTAEQKAEVSNVSKLEQLQDTFDALLDEARGEAKAELNAEFAGLDEDDYTEDNWEAIEDILKEAKADIDDAGNTDEIEDIVSDALKAMEKIAEGDAIRVTFRLIGDSKHDNGVTDHEEYVTWIPTTTYTLEPGATMYDVFVMAIADHGLSQRGAASGYVSGVRAPSVLGGYWLSEFDNGRNSGWMYTVNGSHPGKGLTSYTLEDGDRIIWHYTDDYTLEERNSSSKYYYRWLEAKDISPEEYLKQQDKEEVDTDFGDVNASDWFDEDVEYVVSNGLFKGVGNGNFAPDAAMTRAMLVTVLYRLEGEPSVSGSSRFTDVSDGQWYAKAVAWASANGIVNGVGNSRFDPNSNITREQMAAILYRYAQYKDYDVTETNSLTKYTDFDQISVYALTPLKWANAEGLITGRTSTTLAPKGTATRAEVAAILHRFVENVVND